MWVNNMENKYYNENYYNANTVLKFLRKVLNEINKSYVDSGMRTAFLMKRYIEKYKIDEERCHEHVLLCMLKDIGLFYMDGAVPSNDPALAAASSYAFLHQCSPLSENARPLLFYKAKYMEDVSNPDYDMGLLMTLLYQVSLYIYQRKDIEEIEEILREERKRKTVNPDQVKKVIKLLKDCPDIIEKLNSESELYVYETSRYISLANYGTDTLAEFLDTTSFMFEFHNHETMAHTVTTAQIAYDLAIACKLTESTSRAIEIAGKVHDIGKIRIPLEILCFPGKLEGEALEEMQNHAKYTKEIIEGCFSYVIVEIASRHHEKLDGSGYPLGITRKDLTSADKVLAVADICSALYCKRSYKAAFTPEKIQAILISDAKAGKLDERIVNHLIDDYDKIMANAKAVEDVALKKYETMKDEYEALAQSPALRHVFGESEDVERDRPESVAADETEEYISGVINYDVKKDSDEVEEQIIYVDEDGNEIDYNPEEAEEYYQETEDAEFNIEEDKVLDPLEEYNQAEMGDVPIEEIKSDDDFEEEEEKEETPLPVFDLNPKEEPKEEESKEDIDDEFDAFLNTIPEAKEEAKPKKEFTPRAKLTRPGADFDPFKEEIDPVFQEPILPKVETKEDIDDEFDAFLNTIPEVKEDPFKEEPEEEAIEESEETFAEELVEETEEAPIEEPVEEVEENIEESNEKFQIELEEEVESQEETDETENDLEEEKPEEIDAEEEELDDTTEEVDDSEEEELDDTTEEVDDLVEEELDDSTEEDSDIDSKYDNDPEEEIDDNTYVEEEKKAKEEAPEDDYVTSYVDEDEFDLIEDEAPEDTIVPDESKYDDDPNEEIDDSSYQEESKELEEEKLEESNEEESKELEEDNSIEAAEESKEDDYVTSYVDEDEFESESKEESKEDDYVTSYVDEDEFESESKEDDYVTSYVDEDEFEEESKEESKEDDYVTSYVDEDEFEEESETKEEEPSEVFNPPLEEPKEEKSKSDDDESDSDEEDDDEDEDEDDEDNEDDDEVEEEEDAEEDTNPKHKKFFSNDIYRKMFTYNPKNKKK